jgi:hypothetical protein
MCGLTGRKNTDPEIHHIDGDKGNNDIRNLVVLCHEHHQYAQMGISKGKSSLTARKLKPEHVRSYREKWLIACWLAEKIQISSEDRSLVLKGIPKRIAKLKSTNKRRRT